MSFTSEYYSTSISLNYNNFLIIDIFDKDRKFGPLVQNKAGLFYYTFVELFITLQFMFCYTQKSHYEVPFSFKMLDSQSDFPLDDIMVCLPGFGRRRSSDGLTKKLGFLLHTRRTTW